MNIPDKPSTMLREYHLSRGEDGRAIFRELPDGTMAFVLTDAALGLYANRTLLREDSREQYSRLQRCGWKANRSAPHNFSVLLRVAKIAPSRGWEELQ